MTSIKKQDFSFTPKFVMHQVVQHYFLIKKGLITNQIIYSTLSPEIFQTGNHDEYMYLPL